jgi:hypothetical protein
MFGFKIYEKAGVNDDDDDDDDCDNFDVNLVDNRQSYSWLKFGDVKGETASTTLAAQDLANGTNCFTNKILKEGTDIECRLCKQQEETTEHPVSGCYILAKNEYLMRHDKVSAHLHLQQKSDTHTHTHTHKSKPVSRQEDVTELRNHEEHRDRKHTVNRPDIIIKNRKEKTCILIDAAVPWPWGSRRLRLLNF